jgi:hypothetical protein
MARLVNGINGPFVGKVGTVIGSSWKGIPYMKSLNKKRTKRASEKERKNREKFAQAQHWLQPLIHFVRQGFKGYTPTVEGFVAAKSYLLKNAVEKTDTGFFINPSLMKVSFGDLPLPDNIRVELVDNIHLQFSWKEPNKNHQYDQAMLLAYNIEKGKVNMKLTGQFRSMESDSLSLKHQPGTYHVYIAFVAADRSRQSHSVYLGEITSTG